MAEPMDPRFADDPRLGIPLEGRERSPGVVRDLLSLVLVVLGGIVTTTGVAMFSGRLAVVVAGAFLVMVGLLIGNA